MSVGPARALALALSFVVALVLLAHPPAPVATPAGPSVSTHPFGPESGYPPIRITISATPTHGVAPLTVQFTATATGGNGAFVGFAWSFGDGGSGSGARLNYTYEATGNYTVRLNVSDSAGDRASQTAGVLVTPFATVSGGTLDPSPWLIYIGLGGGAAVLAALLLWSARFARRDGLPPSDPNAEATPREPEPPVASPEPDAPELIVPPPVPEPTIPITPTGSLRGSPPTSTAPAFTARTTSRPAPRAPVALGAVPREVLRISHRVILHLARQGVPPPHEVARMEQTQQGMGKEFGSTQSGMSNVLQRLAAAGVITFEVRHVAGHPRRLRVYYLTPYGESLARDLRRKDAARSHPSNATSTGSNEP